MCSLTFNNKVEHLKIFNSDGPIPEFLYQYYLSGIDTYYSIPILFMYIGSPVS